MGKGSISLATNPIPEDVDIVMTHGPPRGVLDECAGGNVGCPNLLRAMERVRPMLHCFGHIHEGHGVEIVDWRKRERDVAIEEAEESRGIGRRKNESVHRYFEEDQVENPYPGLFLWDAGHGYRKGETTLMVNASVMDGAYKWRNPPWRVRLGLRPSGV